jgi:hypothetical protein
LYICGDFNARCGDINARCGDFNARCGDIQDFIEGVDNVQIRNVIDDVSNRNGDLLI